MASSVGVSFTWNLCRAALCKVIVSIVGKMADLMHVAEAFLFTLLFRKHRLTLWRQCLAQFKCFFFLFTLWAIKWVNTTAAEECLHSLNKDLQLTIPCCVTNEAYWEVAFPTLDFLESEKKEQKDDQKLEAEDLASQYTWQFIFRWACVSAIAGSRWIRNMTVSNHVTSLESFFILPGCHHIYALRGGIEEFWSSDQPFTTFNLSDALIC